MIQTIEGRVFALLLLVYTAVFLFYYPTAFAIQDESIYYSMAYVLRQFTVFPDQAGIQVLFSNPVGDHLVSKYPLGMPLLIIPFTLFGHQAVFLTNLTLHLIGCLVFFLILKRLRVSTYYTVLYIFFPSFTIYSRTLMSDLPAGVFVLLGFYYYLGNKQRDLVISGLCFGESCLIRYVNLIAFVPFLIFSLIEDMRRARDNGRITLTKLKTVSLISGFMPVAIFILSYNVYVYHNPLAVGYSSTEIQSFGLKYFLHHFPIYFTSLNVIYPFALISLAAYRGRGYKEIISATLVFTIFYSFWYYIQSGSGLIQKLVLSNRFIFPVVGFVLLAYCAFLNRYQGKLPLNLIRALYGLTVCLLVAATLLISAKHQKLLNVNHAYQDMIYENTGDNANLVINEGGIKFLNHRIGRRTYQVFENEGQTRFNTSMMATNRENYLVVLLPVERYAGVSQKILEIKDTILSRFEYRLVKNAEEPYLLEVYHLLCCH